MAKIPVDAILWRQVTKTNYNTLSGTAKGEYDIRLGIDDEIDSFFRGVSKTDQTALGGYTLKIDLAPLESTSPVPKTPLRVRYMGPRSSRGDWNIPSQRPDTAYPLWRLSRVNPNQAEDNYIVIARCVDGTFHARWLKPKAFGQLPIFLQKRFSSATFGVISMSSDGASDMAEQLAKKLRKDHNVLLYGPPGTGKSKLMWDVANAMKAPAFTIDTTAEDEPFSGGGTGKSPLIRWVTFHQSYGYEDFVIGLRPDAGSSQLLSLRAAPGVLLELAEHCRITGEPAVLLIDEINRGNVSRIFGEFITLLEADKRLGSDGKATKTTVGVNLPYVDHTTTVEFNGTQAPITNPFTLPENLYVLASMNSVDRSVAPLDAAIRRRFRIINLDANLTELEGAFAASPPTMDDNEVKALRQVSVGLLRHLNDGIAAFRGVDYQMGQWYLAGLLGAKNLADTESALVEIWNEKLLPHLEDIFHGRAEQLIALLGEDGPLEVISPSSEYENVGARVFLRHRDFDGTQVLTYLTKLVGTTSASSENVLQTSTVSTGDIVLASA